VQAASELRFSADTAPEEVLVQAAARFSPRIAFATGFGMEGCVLLHMIADRGLPIDVFTLDTGLLFPETYELWKRLEALYGLTIRAVRPEQTVEQQETAFGPGLWAREPDRCCALRKVLPLRRELAGLDAWVTAVRRDQTRERANVALVERDEKFGLVKINPLAAWSAADVRAYVEAHGVPVSPLHARGYPSIGCVPCTTPVAEGEDPRSGRWRGLAKTECGLHAKSGTNEKKTENTERMTS
jgi:phosphoadenosine phosphosulfate reductase